MVESLAVGSLWRDKDPRYTERIVEVVRIRQSMSASASVKVQVRTVVHAQSPRAVGRDQLISAARLVKFYEPVTPPERAP